MDARGVGVFDLTSDGEQKATLQPSEVRNVAAGLLLRKRCHVPITCVDLTRSDSSTDIGLTRRLLGASLLVPDVMMLLVTFAQLSTASRLASTDRGNHESVVALLGQRLALLSHWARIIWVEKTVLAIETAVTATAAMPPLPGTLQTNFINALGMVADSRNRCPNRVGVVCYSRPLKRNIALKLFFKCPHRHGWLQAVRGIPAAYTMRHSTDDLTLSCTSCGRDQIEEDPKMFHCPRFGCCYDLCLVCAAGLAQNRKHELDSIEIE